jgi:putative membrane protein
LSRGDGWDPVGHRSQLGNGKTLEMSGLQELPLVNACLNGLSGTLLSFGLYFILNKNERAHRACMLAAFGSSIVFLITYVIHKVFVVRGVNTPFLGPTALKPWYLLMLATHIILAIAIVPLACITIFRGLKDRRESHRRIARWTWPLWMYVSITGVVIYLVLYQVWPAHARAP